MKNIGGKGRQAQVILLGVEDQNFIALCNEKEKDPVHCKRSVSKQDIMLLHSCEIREIGYGERLQCQEV